MPVKKQFQCYSQHLRALAVPFCSPVKSCQIVPYAAVAAFYKVRFRFCYLQSLFGRMPLEHKPVTAVRVAVKLFYFFYLLFNFIVYRQTTPYSFVSDGKRNNTLLFSAISSPYDCSFKFFLTYVYISSSSITSGSTRFP